MLERVQERSRFRILGVHAGIQLRGAQKALAQWAVVDDYNMILDMHCQDAQLLRYLSQKYSLRACGIADDAASARRLREEAPEAEIFCARKEDIPWRSESFDAIFYQLQKKERFDKSFLQEAMRVLKPGGQMLVAIKGMPEAAYRAAGLLGVAEHEEHTAPHMLLRGMEQAGMRDVSYRVSRPLVGIAMGWKRS